MRRLLCFVNALGIWMLLLVTPALASPIIWELIPSSPAVIVGQALTVDVILSGRSAEGAAVAGFDFDVTFDTAILFPTVVTFGSFLGTPEVDALTAFSFSPGVVDFAAVSLLSPAELRALQPETFRLASLSFSALATGAIVLAFAEQDVKDEFGARIPPIPEPATMTMILLGAGLGGIAARFRGRSH